MKPYCQSSISGLWSRLASGFLRSDHSFQSSRGNLPVGPVPGPTTLIRQMFHISCSTKGCKCFFIFSNLGVEEIGNLGIFSVFRLKTLRFQSSEEGFCRASSLRTKEGKKGKSLKQG
ncbi:hypothetical protein MRB53_025648 [Persea americana]|uniref:Uncharacterized protein n=1 Tax=Persea americana TaxID=3435 RepID=A0ACC2LGT5_PERAE|nr:hypothetical protein MRB53_025648 [Persea americana]